MSTSAANGAQLHALIMAAERAEAAGKPDEAARALAQARIIAPEDSLVLSALGMRALRNGDAAAAHGLLEQASARDPESPMLWLNLALARRALRDEPGERAALDKALKLDPRFFLALLQKARLLERQGRAKQAAFMYHAFLCCVPPGPHPPGVQAAMAHARGAVETNDAQLDAHLRARLQEARARNSGNRLDRFDHCIDALLGRKRIFVQQPTFMHFPRLPAIQFYDRDPFPWLDRVEVATDAIRSELAGLLAEDAEGFVPYISKPEGGPLDQWKELNNSRRWSTFFLWRNGRRIDEHVARCPRTAALLEELPLCDVPGHAPAVFFSVLAPNTRIPPHTGVTNTRVIVHLPLIVPPACSFRVGADVREWHVGKAWVFDDTIEHEAWNDSSEPRTILIFDVWNPFLTAAERDLVRAATIAVKDFYGGDDPFDAGF